MAVAGQLMAGLMGFVGLCLPLAAADDDDIRRLADETRKIAVQLIQQVKGELIKEMEHGGVLRSIVVCKYSVPEISSAISRRHGMRVTRVSLRPRNPSLATPDAWEQRVLQEFDRRVARGEKAENLEQIEVVAEPAGRFLRYMKAIPIQSNCLGCHGSGDTVSDAVRMQLASEYPHDRAVGYALGQVSGAVTVKRPL